MNTLFSFFNNLLTPLLMIFVLLIILTFAFYIFRGSRRGNAFDPFENLYLKIKEDIKYAVSPKFVELSLGVNDLVDLAVEVWRMEQRIAKSVSCLPENQLKGLENSVQKLRRYLEKYDIEIVDYKNTKYNDGFNLDVLSIEKDPTLSEPRVKEVVEPTIMYKGQVVRKAKIILLTNN